MGVKLKLLVNSVTKKVVFAEAGKEFVDFLMGLMEIPLGSILRLLKQNSENRDGNSNLSLEKLYESIYLFDESYLQKSDVRSSVLDPKFSSVTKVKQAHVLQQLIQVNSNYSSYSQSSRDEIDGYVKGAANYMVKDDLSITPCSTISSINLFNIHGVKDISFLQEMTVEVDGKKVFLLPYSYFSFPY
ncbi:uncharacterized protein LOC110687643 isoform X1 [Chenopodium quinoa]|uniref:uncharacterized protein LOC110687643 isoform X1 n=1 Tax=Chenopodium quinoa TaxID=63459 RepID=UPI000B7903DF|nr:uncharacterized protein LOC110687643 isoform X1 [Chenopodium quinoa]